MEKTVVFNLRALRRALEGGASVEKILLLQGQAPPRELWHLIKKYELPFQHVPAGQLPKGQAWVAYLSPLPLYALEACLAEPPQGVALALVGLTDPHNVGAICRHAAAFGVTWVFLRSEGTPLLSNETIWRSSAGALPHLKFVRTPHLRQSLRKLREAGWHAVGTVRPTFSGALPYRAWSWEKPTLILLGSEEKGLPPEYLAECEQLLTIPHTPRVESLNVSAAAAILLAEAYFRQEGR